jgi:Putative transposase
MTTLTDPDPETALGPLQAAACTYRSAFGPRAGQKVLSLQTVSIQAPPPALERCVNEHGFSLHAGCGLNQRHKLEQLCRYITRPALANERLTRNRAGDVVLQLKSPYHDGTTHIVMSPLEFMQRLAGSSPVHGSISVASTACSRPTPGCVPRSFRAHRSTPLTPQRSTVMRHRHRRLPP